MAKKKTVHWSKLPRAKLIAMVKRLELQKIKLSNDAVMWRGKYERSQAASGCLNDGDVIWLRDVDGTGSLHPCAKFDVGAIAYIPADDRSGVEVRTVFPWEQK